MTIKLAQSALKSTGLKPRDVATSVSGRSNATRLATGMGYHRQKDHSRYKVTQRAETWIKMTNVLLHRRKWRKERRRTAALAIQFCISRVGVHVNQFEMKTRRVEELQRTNWYDMVMGMADDQLLLLFRVCRAELPLIVEAVGWHDELLRTKRNEYGTCPLLTTLIILRRLASPCRWADVEGIFGKHCSQLSEIFWEGVENMIERRGHLLTGPISTDFMHQHASKYARVINDKCDSLSECVGFIDGTVLSIARPGDSSVQNAAYNGHKRRHALKYQTITLPDGLILHASGPLEGCRHDWALYVNSGIEPQLEEMMLHDGVQYFIHGDSGYNERVFMDVPFSSANLTPAQRAANMSTASVRVTVEWMYKEVKLYWSTVDFKRKMRIGEGPVGLLYIAAMMLTNFRNCIYPNSVSQYFKCSPPTLEEYLTHKD